VVQVAVGLIVQRSAPIPPPSTPMSWYGLAPRVSSTLPTIVRLLASAFSSISSGTSSTAPTESSEAIVATFRASASMRRTVPSSEKSLTAGAPRSFSTSPRSRAISWRSAPGQAATISSSVVLRARLAWINGVRPSMRSILKAA